MAVTGPSGAGKTLLLRAIADLDPNEGDVRAGGLLRAKTPAPRWRQSVAYVAAESAWWADTVAEHFADPAAARPLFQALGLPPDCANWRIARLSSGEKQRLALARSLVKRPPVLLLDEPTAALDETSVQAVEMLVQAEKSRGTALLLVTHDAGQALRLAERRLRVADGRVTETTL